MRSMRVRLGPKESTILAALRDALHAAGWLVVEKLHGNAFQPGLPDLFCWNGQCFRWIEVKRPRGGRLTKAQRIKFTEWERAGLGVWILTGPMDLPKLMSGPNWREWERKGKPDS